MNKNQWLGLALVIFGILVAVYGIQGIPLSTISIGPVTISDIPPRSAAAIGVGIVLVLIGLYQFSRRD
jgi:hypothetical protein